MNDFADFWQTIEEKGIRGWLSHRWRYAQSEGCFPIPNAVSRLHDIAESGITATIAILLVKFVLIPAFSQIITQLPTNLI